MHDRPVLRQGRGVGGMALVVHSDTTKSAAAGSGTCTARCLATVSRSTRTALTVSIQGELKLPNTVDADPIELLRRAVLTWPIPAIVMAMLRFANVFPCPVRLNRTVSKSPGFTTQSLVHVVSICFMLPAVMVSVSPVSRFWVRLTTV